MDIVCKPHICLFVYNTKTARTPPGEGSSASPTFRQLIIAQVDFLDGPSGRTKEKKRNEEESMRVAQDLDILDPTSFISKHNSQSGRNSVSPIPWYAGNVG